MLMGEDWSAFYLYVTVVIKGTTVLYLLDHVSQEDFIERYMETYREFGCFHITNITILTKDSFDLLTEEFDGKPAAIFLD